MGYNPQESLENTPGIENVGEFVLRPMYNYLAMIHCKGLLTFIPCRLM